MVKCPARQMKNEARKAQRIGVCESGDTGVPGINVWLARNSNAVAMTHAKIVARVIAWASLSRVHINSHQPTWVSVSATHQPAINQSRIVRCSATMKVPIPPITRAIESPRTIANSAVTYSKTVMTTCDSLSVGNAGFVGLSLSPHPSKSTVKNDQQEIGV